MKKVFKNIDVKIIYLIITIVFTIPSILYLLKYKSIINFNSWFTYFLRDPVSKVESVISGIIFFCLISLLSILMILIIKNNTKIFRTKKRMFVFITVVSILFGIILPFTTSDIFYYIGTGQLDAKYGENPYYTSVKELRNQGIQDEILNRTGVWEGQTVVYGPLWALLCKIFATLSFNSSLLSLYVFKLFSIIAHISICILIYKITNKEKYVILYGLNPFVLFEMITNVHNDIYLILFIMLALYYLIKKRNIFLVLIFSACAVAIKYVAVLILPFMVIYYFKDYKIAKRLLYSFFCAIFFTLILALFYLAYFKDISLFFNVLMQQNKYRESILAIILHLSNLYNKGQFFQYIELMFKMIFSIIYLGELISFISKKNITLKDMMYINNKILFLFLFLVITNLCPWYISWLIPIMFWQKEKVIELILFIQISYELCLTYNFMLYSESYKIGLLYLPTIGIVYLIYSIIENQRIKTCKEKKWISY